MLFFFYKKKKESFVKWPFFFFLEVTLFDLPPQNFI